MSLHRLVGIDNLRAPFVAIILVLRKLLLLFFFLRRLKIFLVAPSVFFVVVFVLLLVALHIQRLGDYQFRNINLVLIQFPYLILYVLYSKLLVLLHQQKV